MASLPALLLFCSFVVAQCSRSAEVEVPGDIEKYKSIRYDEPEGRRCYTCRRVGDNEECNQEISQCGKGEFCRTVVNFKHNSGIKVTKTCRKTCRTPNQTFCHEAGTKCWYCCDTDLCNKGLNYKEDSKGNVTTKCPAARGPPGPEGPPGVPGMKGMKGDDGLHGLDGRPGLPGLPGRKGDKGTPGLPGLHGQKGSTGLPGLDGLPGLHAPTPERGQKGDMGPPGMDGFPGAPGLPGLPGAKGHQGSNGSPGDCTCPQPPPEVPKPEAVVFYGRMSSVSQMGTSPVNLMIDTTVNLGHAYNTTTSVFTAPYRAAYLFSVHVICDGNKAVPLLLYKNEESVASSGRREDIQMGTGAFYPVGIIQVILTLEVGDEVTLRISPQGEGFWDRFKSFMASHSDVTYSGHMIGYA